MKKLFLAFAAVALTASTSLADPHEDREALMKSFGGALGKLAPMAKGEQPFDAEATNAALTTLNEQVQKLDVAALFPEGSITGDSRALPAIWENMGDFESRAEKLKTDVGEVVASPPTNQGELGAALGKIGGNCGGCHETYRASES